MKVVFLLAALTFVAIMAAETEDMNNLLKREERSAIGGRRPGPNIRKKRKQSKNSAKKGKKGKKGIDRKVKMKAGSMQENSDRKAKGKSADRQTCSDDAIADTLQKIGAWRSAIKNTRNLYNNLVDKVSVNGIIKESLSKYVEDAKTLIGSLTDDGEKCKDPCSADACAAFKTLSNCSTSIVTACEIPQTVTTAKLSEADEDECFTQLDAYEQTCTSSNRTKCCSINWNNINQCKYTDIVKNIRQASKSCLDARIEGTLSNCMLKVKQTPFLVKNCTGTGTVIGTPVNCELNSTCSDRCYKDFGNCIDTCILTVANCSYPTPTFNETSKECTCLPEDAKNGDYAKCEGDSCECVPKCQTNDQCPGWNTTCNTNLDNCGYCGNGDGDGCCLGCYDDSQCAFPRPNCVTVFSNSTTRMDRASLKQANTCSQECRCTNSLSCGTGYECNTEGTECVLKPVNPGIPSVNQVQFCSVQCANCAQESVNLQLTGQYTVPPRSCDTSIPGNPTDFNKISPIFTNTSIPGCFLEPLFSIASAKVTWTGTGAWTPNQVCIDWIPETTGAVFCTFNQTALNNGEFATSTSCIPSSTEVKCNYDSTTCPQGI